MKNVLGAAALATAVMAGPALADTIAFPPSGVASFKAGSDFTYDFGFDLGSATSIDAITASSSSVNKVGRTSVPNLSFSSVQLFDSNGVSLFQSAAAGQFIGVFPGIEVSAGGYTLEIKGTVARGNSLGSFNGNLSVSAVPLPSSVAMFGTALIGLAVMGGVGAKRRKVSSAAA